jgi:hypothetical protein
MIGRLIQYLNNLEDNIPAIPMAIMEVILLTALFGLLMFLFIVLF